MAKPPLPSAQPTRRIRLVADHLVAAGPYRHGQDYDVPADVADRLVPARGFIYIDATDTHLTPHPLPLSTEETT